MLKKEACANDKRHDSVFFTTASVEYGTSDRFSREREIEYGYGESTYEKYIL